MMLIPDGILPLKKSGSNTDHKGYTSHDMVSKIRKLFMTRAVGHTGTLDPMADGVLVVLLGRSTKCERFLSNDSKTYVAGMKLGLTTDTEDSTGSIITTSDHIPTADQTNIAALSFLGQYEQLPPMYSAVKINGKKLYEYAREGRPVERKPRTVTVSDISCSCINESSGDYSLTCTVSSGTYIRTLCADIGAKLGCGAIMTSLTRIKAGSFTIDDCITLEQLENMSYEQRLNMLIPPQNALEGEKITLPDFYEKLYLSGCEIYQKKIGTALPVDSHVLVFDKNDKFLSYGTVKNYPAGTAIKSEILFNI